MKIRGKLILILGIKRGQ